MPVYQLGEFRLDTAAYRLTKNAAVLTATPRQLDLLSYLATRPGQLVTRDELFQQLWPDVIVSDNALTQLVSDLRQVLGDASSAPRYVQTVARRGYRFIAAVELTDPSAIVLETTERSAVRPRGRETSNLEVLRAVVDGRLQLEALDANEVAMAIANFERAVALDPGFAAAYVGLANAHFWQYEQSRFLFRPDSGLLATAIHEARRGVALAPDYAEAHATLAYLFAGAGRTDEAMAAAHRAIALQPDYWGHHFRLGHVSWGQVRLDSMSRGLALYPEFPFAYFEMATVHVARQALEMAIRVLEEGVALQDSLAAAPSRFPASGLHWMLGTIRLARGDAAGALEAFDREMNSGGSGLYAREHMVASLNGRAFALARGGHREEAAELFSRSLALHPQQVRPHLGRALLARHGGEGSLERALADAAEAISGVQRGGRTTEALLMSAAEQVVRGQLESAYASLDQLLTERPSGAEGWLIPIEPLFEPLAGQPAFRGVLAKLAQRAA